MRTNFFIEQKCVCAGCFICDSGVFQNEFYYVMVVNISAGKVLPRLRSVMGSNLLFSLKEMS